jgi:hypothetical protein
MRFLIDANMPRSAAELLKRYNRLETLGVEYDVRTVVFLACSLIAMRTKNARFHAAFAMIGTVYILSVIFRQYFLVL